MKRLALLILLPLLGCGYGHFSEVRPDGTRRDLWFVDTIKSPTIGHFKLTPGGGLTLDGFSSKSEMTGADLVTIAASLAKILLAVP